VLDGDPTPPPKKNKAQPPFSVHVCCRQTAGWTKVPLGREVDLVPGCIVFDGEANPQRGTAQPNFGPSAMTERLDGSRCRLVRRYASAQATLC